LTGQSFSLVIVNDIPALPLGLRIAGASPVILDAHEYSPAEFEDRLLWRLRYGRHYTHICRTALPRVAAMTTVCEGIADQYSRQFGVRPVVVENAPPLQTLAPQPVMPDRVRMIHHGAAIRSRKLELMIDTLKLADRRFTLDFMLVGNDTSYIDELKRRAADDPRIRFVDPVAMPEICRATNGYDIGLFVLPPTNFNYRFALPNKLFEFIQARLAVVIGPSTEMARIVHRHGVGIVADSYDPAEVATRLNAMTIEDLVRYKAAADRAASVLCFEAVSTRLLEIIDGLLTRAEPTSVPT
jgi:glycosyltransferase involved in cell wall biosynthesis